ncbi:hypothetical protein SDC9_125300 [bioreactor metagenome]|jgi:hypothetical protein|uniref:Uncharacterized protein n=1 Tax=bioreactor metagenome TaxID=1076179 RepID=A0A645CN14_9ZZZZ|nr:hypothetical protein [Sedimentibacter saalensis]MEA5095081.1 hypothetical protein [Sedimentibacter saalensis]
MNKKMDYILGIFFAVATVVFIILFLTNDIIFNWAFARHHNIWSWYIRPLFIIPIIFFAFKKSLTGIFASIFALFTSMFWFPAPETSSPQVMTFLAYEMEYLKGVWTAPKIIMSLSVPIFFIVLIIAAWKKNWRLLLGVVIAAALLKIIWSVVFSGEAGMSVLKPAITGLIICIGGVYYYKKNLSKKK